MADSYHFYRNLVGVALIGSLAGCGNSFDQGESSLLKIKAVTTGVSLDPDGYNVHLRSSQGEQVLRVKPTGFVAFDRLAGTYTALLTDVSPNCTQAGAAQRTFTVSSHAVEDSATFNVTCAHANGSLTVYTSLPDSFGTGPFTVTLEGSDPRALGAVDSTRFTDLADGTYVLKIAGVRLVDFGCETDSLFAAVSGGKGASATFSPASLASNEDCE